MTHEVTFYETQAVGIISITSDDSSIFQRISWFAHCTDEDQKSETTVCIWKSWNGDKLSETFRNTPHKIPV